MTPLAAYQTSLFAQGEPALSDTAGVERINLDQTSWIDLSRGWLHGADDLLDRLATGLAWESARRPMYGSLVEEPRLHASVALGAPSTPAVIGPITHWLEARYGEGLTSGFVNYYRNGADSVAWHADRVGVHRVDPVVALVSLGGPRRFQLRPMGGGAGLRLMLGSGDLLVMGGACQHNWEHCVKPQVNANPRMSLSFRHVEDNPYSIPGHRSFPVPLTP